MGDTQAMATLSQAGAATYESNWSNQKDGRRSHANYIRAIHVAPLSPDRDVTGVTTHDLSLTAAAMRESGLAPATVNRLMSAVKVGLRTCVDMGVIKDMPRCRPLRENKGRTYVIPDEDIDAIVYYCLVPCALQETRRHIGALIRFLSETGLRLSEALKLKWEDTKVFGPDDCLQGVVVVRDSKGGKDREVPLTHTAARLLVKNRVQGRLRTDRTVSVLVRSFRPGGKGPFSGVSSSSVQAVFANMRDRVGQSGNPECVIHALRHSYASRLSNRGVAVQHIQALLGHADIATTMRYVHASQSVVFDSFYAAGGNSGEES